jgi:dephospho-CoA kinase
LSAADSIFVVVLTGGIASGKTAVSDLFAAKGAPVVDTDVIAHQVVQPGNPALEQITHEFGSDYLDSEGNLNRRKMRAAIFTDPKSKRTLEGILHPAIGQEVQKQVSAIDGPWCVLVVPLLAESNRYAWGNRVLVVDVEEDVQIERVMARDQISRDQAESILQTQATRSQRLAIADDVIKNSDSLNQLATEVDRLYHQYTNLAASYSAASD